jgi:hypothetical protein
MNDCPRVGWMFGCKFEPRYDLSAPDVSRFKKIDGPVAPVLEATKAKTYVCDVCVRCGKTIERNK